MAPPMYTDMDLRWQSDHNLPEIVEMGIHLGYERMAINYFVPSLKGAKGKKQSEKLVIPPPSEILLNTETMKALQLKGQSFQQLSRFTAVLEDASNTHRLGSPEVQAYDIIAVQTTNEKTFQLACSTLDIDVISLNFSEGLGFSLKRALVNMAAKRGIHFEIAYSPAFRDSGVKRNIISNAMSLVSAAGGKNIILSSGSNEVFDLRSPYDVINLAKLFGLSHSQAKDAICKNCRAVLKHAESRKTCKSVVSVLKSSSLALKEQWILQHTHSGNGKKAGSAAAVDESDKETDEEDDDADDNSMEGHDSEKDSSDILGLSHRKKRKL